MLRKILSLIVVVTFLFNEMAFALSPEIVSGNPASPIKSAMYAAGQKLFAMKKGPGSELVRSIDKAMEGVFIGNKPSISGVKFVKADNEQLPKGWEKNPILSKTSLLEAFEYFRDNEARISKKGLNIKEGYFEVDATKGELPIARVEANNDGTYTLILHTKFVQMWNHIRANDIWFKTRGFTVSLAWGIFYRVAKHEMADLTTLSHIQKGGGHLVSDDTKSAEIGVAHPGEHFANMIGGGYSLINDGLWMWFLGSYCFGDSTRYNNDILKDRLGWFFSHEGKELGFAEEFSSYPNALYLPKREVAIKLALAVNYYFFKDRPSAKVPEFTVKPIYIEEAKARQANIKSVLPATGEDKTITSTISHPIPLENMPFYEKTMKWYMGEKANAALTDPVRHTLLVAEYGPEKANMAWSLLRSIRNIETGQTGAMTPAGIAETLDMMEKTRRIMIKVMDDEQDNIFGGGPGRNVRTHLRMLIQKLPCYKDAAAALGISFTGDPADSEIKLIAANVLSLYSFDFGDMYFTMFGPYQEGQYVTTGAVDEALDAFLDFYNANPIQIGDLSLPKTPQTNFTKEADLDNRSAALESLGRDPAREMREAATVQSFRANFRALESELRKRGANFDFIDESAIAWVSNAHTRNKIDLIGKCLRLYHRYYNTKDGTQKGMVVEFYPGKTLLAWEDDSAIVRHTGSDWMHSHTIKGPPPIHYFAISGDLELFAVMAPKFIREYRAHAEKAKDLGLNVEPFLHFVTEDEAKALKGLTILKPKEVPAANLSGKNQGDRREKPGRNADSALVVISRSKILRDYIEANGCITLKAYRDGYNEVREGFGFAALPEKIENDTTSRLDLRQLVGAGYLEIVIDPVKGEPYKEYRYRPTALGQYEMDLFNARSFTIRGSVRNPDDDIIFKVMALSENMQRISDDSQLESVYAQKDRTFSASDLAYAYHALRKQNLHPELNLPELSENPEKQMLVVLADMVSKGMTELKAFSASYHLTAKGRENLESVRASDANVGDVDPVLTVIANSDYLNRVISAYPSGRFSSTNFGMGYKELKVHERFDKLNLPDVVDYITGCDEMLKRALDMGYLAVNYTSRFALTEAAGAVIAAAPKVRNVNEEGFKEKLAEYGRALYELLSAQSNMNLAKILAAKNQVMYRLEKLRMDSQAIRPASMAEFKYDDLVCNLATKEVIHYGALGKHFSEDALLKDCIILRPLTISPETRQMRDSFVKTLQCGRTVGAREEALRQLKSMIDKGLLPVPVLTDDAFQHCHSTYSHSPGDWPDPKNDLRPGNTPAYIAWKGYMLGLLVTGIVDHDTVDGNKEFLECAKILGLRNPTTGYEQRVIAEGTPFEFMQTNAPGNVGETYVAFHGVSIDTNDGQKKVVAAKIERFRKNADFINGLNVIPGEKLDYDKHIKPLTEANNPTEKHVSEAIARLIYNGFAAEIGRGEWGAVVSCANKLIEECSKEAGDTRDLSVKGPETEFLKDLTKFTFLIRNRVVTVLKKSIKPTRDEVVPIRSLYEYAHSRNELVYYCYLGGEKPCEAESRAVLTPAQKRVFIANMKGTLDPAILDWWLKLENATMLHLWFRYQKSIGADGVALMPNRNSPEEVEAVIRIARESGFERIANGMDVNTPDMPFIYFDYSNRPDFVKESLTIVAHENKMRAAPAPARTLGPDAIDSGKSLDDEATAREALKKEKAERMAQANIGASTKPLSYGGFVSLIQTKRPEEIVAYLLKYNTPSALDTIRKVLATKKRYFFKSRKFEALWAKENAQRLTVTATPTLNAARRHAERHGELDFPEGVATPGWLAVTGRRVQGYTVWNIGDDNNYFEITEFGAAVTQLVLNGENIIWQKEGGNKVQQDGNRLAVSGGIPLMLPVNGRTLYGGMLTQYGGLINVLKSPLARTVPANKDSEYKHLLHGFTDKVRWNFQQRSKDSITLSVTSREINMSDDALDRTTLADIIGNVKFTQTYRLEEGKLTSILETENLSDKPIVLGGGYHPFYQLADLEDWTIQIPADQYLSTDSTPLSLDAKPKDVTGTEWDFRTPKPLKYGLEVTLSGLKPNTEILLKNTKTGAQRRIVFNSEHFPYVMLWVPTKESAPAQGIFSVEPLFTVPNGRNMVISGNKDITANTIKSLETKRSIWELNVALPKAAPAVTFAGAEKEADLTPVDLVSAITSSGLTFNSLIQLTLNKTICPKIGESEPPTEEALSYSRYKMVLKNPIPVHTVKINISRIDIEVKNHANIGPLYIQVRLYDGAGNTTKELVNFRFNQFNKVQFIESSLPIPVVAAIAKSFKSMVDRAMIRTKPGQSQGGNLAVLSAADRHAARHGELDFPEYVAAGSKSTSNLRGESPKDIWTVINSSRMIRRLLKSQGYFTVSECFQGWKQVGAKDRSLGFDLHRPPSLIKIEELLNTLHRQGRVKIETRSGKASKYAPVIEAQPAASAAAVLSALPVVPYSTVTPLTETDGLNGTIDRIIIKEVRRRAILTSLSSDDEKRINDYFDAIADSDVPVVSKTLPQQNITNITSQARDDVEKQKKMARNTLNEALKVLRDNNHRGLADELDKLYSEVLPYLVKGQDESPIHHVTYVMKFASEILAAERREGKITNDDIAIVMIAALFHDSGVGYQTVRKIVESEFKGLSGEAASQLMNKAILSRNQHMTSGAGVFDLFSERIKKDLNLSAGSIDKIRKIVSEHDNAKIPLLQVVVNGLNGKPEAGFNEGLLIQRPTDNTTELGHNDNIDWLMQIHLEADMLWMVSKDGIDVDIERAIRNNKKPMSLPDQLKHNMAQHKKIVALVYDKAKTLKSSEYKFKDGYIYRSDEGYRIFLNESVATNGAVTVAPVAPAAVPREHSGDLYWSSAVESHGPSIPGRVDEGALFLYAINPGISVDDLLRYVFAGHNFDQAQTISDALVNAGHLDKCEKFSAGLRSLEFSLSAPASAAPAHTVTINPHRLHDIAEQEREELPVQPSMLQVKNGVSPHKLHDIAETDLDNRSTALEALGGRNPARASTATGQISTLAGSIAQTLAENEKLSGDTAADIAVKELDKNIVDLTAKYAPYYGPGSKKEQEILAPDSAASEGIYKTIALLSDNKIEILIPSSVGLTDTVQNTLSKIRQNKGEKSVVCRLFDSEEHLRDMLSTKPEDGVKRIIISDNSATRMAINNIAQSKISLFTGVRLLSIVLPEGYNELNKQFQSVYQADIITRAVLVRLLEKNGNPFVRSLLKSMIQYRVPSIINPDAFIDNLIEADNEDQDPQAVLNRVRYCLNTMVDLVEKIGEQLIILRHFVWTAA